MKLRMKRSHMYSRKILTFQFRYGELNILILSRKQVLANQIIRLWRGCLFRKLDDFEDIKALTNHHINACDLYRLYTQSLFPGFEKARTLADLPYLPVRAFKEFELKSIRDEDVYKVMRSSGTSGAASLILPLIDKQRNYRHAH